MFPYFFHPGRRISLLMVSAILLFMINPIRTHHDAPQSVRNDVTLTIHESDSYESNYAPTTSVDETALAKVQQAQQSAAVIFTKMEVTATGYSAGVESTGKTIGHPQYGITYSGVKVRRDREKVSTIAADPNVLPLGSFLYIPGYGYGVVADTGSSITGNKIDLYFQTKEQVFSEWGKRKVEVVLLKKGTGQVTEEMLDDLNEAVTSNRHMLELNS